MHRCCRLSLTALYAIAALSVASFGRAQTVTVSQDVSVCGQDFANTNEDANTFRGGLYTGVDGMALGGIDNPARTYLQFVLPAFAPGTEVGTAILSGYYNDDWDRQDNRTHSFYLAASDAWSASTITWNNQPGTTGSAIAVFDAAKTTPGTWQSWDITSAVNAKYQSSGKISLVLRADDETLSANNNNWEYFASHAYDPDLAFRLTLRIREGGVPEPGTFATLAGLLTAMLPFGRRLRRR